MPTTIRARHRRARGLRAAVGGVVIGVATNLGTLLAMALAATPASAQAPTTPGGNVVVNPTSAEFPGGAIVQKLINWAGQFALWGSVASLLIGAGIWGVSQQFGNGLQSGKGKVLAASGAVGAVLTGLAAVIVNTLFTAARG